MSERPDGLYWARLKGWGYPPEEWVPVLVREGQCYELDSPISIPESHVSEIGQRITPGASGAQWSTWEHEIPGWFAEENARELDRLIKEHNVKSVIEIGSFLGRSTAWFARRVEWVTCVDTWREEATEGTMNNLVCTLRRIGIDTPAEFFWIFKRNMEDLRLWSQIMPLRGRSAAVAHQAGPADLLYIDGDHTLAGCADDIKRYGPKSRIVCGDDYDDQPGWGVIEAVDTLLPQRQVSGRFWWAIR